ncbi:hypothetical protein APHAL10511_008574 [Amanita phalloides]|nr:hypothetical protein APHAL10511_008574 [Amanita phalloides]
MICGASLGEVVDEAIYNPLIEGLDLESDREAFLKALPTREESRESSWDGLGVGRNADGPDDVDMLRRGKSFAARVKFPTQLFVNQAEVTNIGHPVSASQIDIQRVDGEDVDRMVEQEMKEVEPRGEAMDIDTEAEDMEMSETSLDNIRKAAFPDEARDVLRQLQEREGGLGVDETLDKLVKIFGPGSESVASTLVDDLVPDPDGSTRATWEVALAQAGKALDELRRNDKDQDQGEVGEMQGKEDDAEHNQALHSYAEYVGGLLM